MRDLAKNIRLPSIDDLFSTEEERQDAKLEKIQILPLSELHPFEGHPFQVRNDEEMDKMVDSVKEYGVMTPAIVRPRRDGGYEIVAGHRRCHASRRAGVDTMPCIVRDMDDDTAIILMVDSNCQREHILPSEKAKAYVDAEKFKTRIYASLYCGEPIIPVLFPENLSQPLLFEKGTIFPWGLRRKKYELLPYEIYQTNNREIAFLRYDYTKDHINAASYKLVYRGQMECWQTLDSLYCLHNQENRPNGRKMRSLSVSDIIVTHEGGEAHAYYVEPIGYKQVDDLLPGLEQTKKRSVVREER